MDLGRWVMLARSWKAEPAAEGNAHAKAKASWLQSNPQDITGLFGNGFIFCWIILSS